MATAKKATVVTPPISIPALKLQTVVVTLIGDSPLIVHAWSAKAKKMMLDKQQKRAAKAREARDPQRDYEESLYRHPTGGFAFPSIGIKAAAVSACSHVAGLTKVETRGSFHIDSELCVIRGEPEMREDVVRVGMGTADLRYRGEFKKWSIDVPVRLNTSSMSPEQLVGLFDLAGFSCGIGEWRPERDGSNGRFHVARAGEGLP